MTKRPSLFSGKADPVAEAPAAEAPQEQPQPRAEAAPSRAAVSGSYQKAATREGKRAVTCYIEPEAFRQLKRLGADEDAQQQDLLVEAINLLFEKRGLSRIA